MLPLVHCWPVWMGQHSSVCGGAACTALGHRRRRGAQGGKPQKTLQSPDRLCNAPERIYKAPTDYTKPRQTIQNSDRLYKASKRLYKAKNYTKT